MEINTVFSKNGIRVSFKITINDISPFLVVDRMCYKTPVIFKINRLKHFYFIQHIQRLNK